METVAKLVQLLKDSKDTLVLTGAGISTESGIPDFRSPDTGLWNQVDPIELFSREVLERDAAKFWRQGAPVFRQLGGARANKGHQALSKLEAMGLISGIVTQNIDNLHQQAGSNIVLEAHGHLRTAYCSGCGEQQDMGLVLDRVETGDNPPKCQCGQVLRPSVILFGDPLPDSFQVAWQWAGTCDLLLVVGSSLEVAPVCWLVPQAANFAIINASSTQMDDMAQVVVHGSAGKVLSQLVDLLT